MLIQLWQLNTPRIKKEIFLCVFHQEESPKTRQWQHILDLEFYLIDVGCISYGTLGACHNFKTFLGQQPINSGWHYWRKKSYERKNILERVSNPGEHHVLFFSLEKNNLQKTHKSGFPTNGFWVLLNVFFL